jgi:hypothetical protein
VSLTRYLFHGVLLDSEIPLPEAMRTHARGRGVRIQRADTPADPPTGDRIEWYNRWALAGAPDGRRHTWLSFGRVNDGYVLSFPDFADFEISSTGDRVRCRAADGLPASTFRHLLLDQVLPLALSQSGELVLHASAVHVPRFGTIAFAGPSGAGKSTLAAALATRGCQLLSDDSLRISPQASAIVAEPGYPGVRLWRETSRSLGLDGRATDAVAHYTRKQRLTGACLPFRKRASPLRLICVLGRRRTASPSRTRTLSTRDSLVALVRYTFVMDAEDRDQLSRMFSGLASIVAKIPVVRLDVRRAGQGLPRTADEVLALARTAADS